MDPNDQFFGTLWVPHEQTMNDLDAWICGKLGTQIVLAGRSIDCPWIDEHGPEAEAAARDQWQLARVPGLRLPPHDVHGTLGWSLAIEAPDENGEWHDVTGRDPDMSQFQYLVHGATAGTFGDPTRMSVHFFRSIVQGNQPLHDAVIRTLAGHRPSDSEARTLAVGSSVSRLNELWRINGCDVWR